MGDHRLNWLERLIHWLLLQWFVRNGWTVSGELPPDRARALEIHLDLCPPCVSFVNTYRDTVNIARTIQPDDIPPELTQRLIDFLRKEKEAPQRRPD